MKLTFQVESRMGDKKEKFDIKPSETCGANSPIVPVDIEQNMVKGVWFEKPKGCCPNLEDAGFVLRNTDNMLDIYPGSKKFDCKLAQEPILANAMMTPKKCPIREWVEKNLPPKKEQPQGSVLDE